jgi:hypothetical protein
MWFRIWKPDYWYFRRSRLLDASDGSPFNRGWSQGFGFFVLGCYWNEGRSQSSDGIHYPEIPRRRITVNGETFHVPVGYIRYTTIVLLAGERVGASVTYRHQCGVSGCLAPGESVEVSEGMSVSAIMTGNA